jgi:Protein of unknown function (DUF559)
MAAILACGDKSMLSHRPAGAAWDLLGYEGRRIDVIVPRGIPVTSVSRTLLDLAEVVRVNLLERAFETAERLNLLDLMAIEELLSRCLRHRGRRALIDVLRRHRVPFMTRSELERAFLELCRDAGLPLPLLNVIVEGFEVDAVWLECKLVVELDSHEFHLTRAAFERDRVRDANLQLAGYRVIRITHRRLQDEPEAIVATLRALLAQTNT